MNVSINTIDKAESSEVLHGAPAIGTVHICPPLETQAFGSPEFSTLSKGLEASHPAWVKCERQQEGPHPLI